MTRPRCCEQPENLIELGRVDWAPRTLHCRVCGSLLATADDRGELFAEY